MPIEPTSVSKPAIREVEKSSTVYASWSSMQGSSTGGKDRPLNSIWEKAINGAQKLFGLDVSKSTQQDETSESDSQSERKEKADTGLDVRLVPGFGNRGLSRYSGSVFGNSPFGTLATSSRNASETIVQERKLDVSSRKEVSAERPGESRHDSAIQPKAKENTHRDEPDDDSEEGKAESRPTPQASAGSSIRGIAGAAGTPAGQTLAQAAPASMETPEQVLARGQAQATSTANAAAAQPAVSPSQPAASAASQAAATAAPAAKTQNSQVKEAIASTPSAGNKNPNTSVEPQVAAKTPSLNTTSSEVSTTGLKQEPVAPSQQTVAASKAPAEPSVKAVAAKEASPMEQTVPVAAKAQAPVSEVAKQAVTETAKPTPLPESVEASASKPANAKTETLGIDVAKAKAAVSEGLNRLESEQPRQPAKAVQTTQATPSTNPATESGTHASKPATVEPATVRLAEGQAKDLPESVLSSEKAKAEPAAASQVRHPADRPGVTNAVSQTGTSKPASDWVAQEVKPTVATQAQTASQSGANAREAANAVASRVQNTAVSATPGNAQANSNGQTATGASGIAATGGSQANPSLQGARSGSQQQGGESAAKQDLNTNLNQSAAKSGEKVGSDAAHSFEAKMETASNRRAEAAAKTRQTSYVSKTAEEVREVVATLSKSIDRLVSSKPGTMNLKLNFEGGGSMNIRISMDGNQVTTQMQTDVSGLESAIKSHWSELSNDWSQKGVKLNVPHFQNADGGPSKEGSSDFNDFAQRGERQSAEGRSDFGGGRGRGSRFAQSGNGVSSPMGEGTGIETPAADSPTETISNAELKTYA